MIDSFFQWMDWLGFEERVRELIADPGTHSLGAVILTNTFIAIWCGVIFAYLILCLLWFFRGAIPLWFSLRRAVRGLGQYKSEEEFTQGFEAYDATLRKSRRLHRIWLEFVESLVLPVPDAPVQTIQNTAPPSSFLNEVSLIQPLIQLRFFGSVPNHLTAAGILGTFVGLAAGIGVASHGLTEGDSEAVMMSLQQLLDGASLAFVTSIFGLSSSLIFLFVERFVVGRLHRVQEAWVSGLESCLRLVTPEHIALDQLAEQKRQTKQLERFNDELVFSLEKALDEAVAAKLVPKLEALIAAVDGLRQDRSDSSMHAIEQIVGQFTRGLTETAGTEFESMSGTLKQLNETLETSMRGMEASQRQLQAITEETRQVLERSMTESSAALQRDLKEALTSVTEAVGRTVGSMTDELTRSGANAASQITGSLAGFERGVQQLERTTTSSSQLVDSMANVINRIDSVADTLASAHTQLRGAADPIMQAVRSLQQSTERVLQAVDGATQFADRVGRSVESLDTQQERIAKAWSDYQGRFEGIDSGLRMAFEQMDQGLNRYTDQIRDFAQQLDQHTGNAISSLASAAQELDGAVSDLSEALTANRR